VPAEGRPQDSLQRPRLVRKKDGGPVFAMPDKPIKLIPTDLDAARGARIKEARSKEGRNERHQSDFLAYRDGAGRVVDFHALRHTYISRLVANAPASHLLSFRGKMGSRKEEAGN
jgi:hypothetical protein